MRRISGNGEAAIAVGDGRRVRPITADHRGHANLNRHVGAGLLANASCQSTPSALNHRVRQQAGSYRLRLAQQGLYGGKPSAGVCRRRICTAANPVQAFAAEGFVRRQTRCRRLPQKDLYRGRPSAGVCRRRICTAANPVQAFAKEGFVRRKPDVRVCRRGLVRRKPDVGVCRRGSAWRNTRCRSALARECVVSVATFSVEPPRSPASRLLQIAFGAKGFVRRQTQCRRLSQKDLYRGKPGVGVCRRGVCTAQTRCRSAQSPLLYA